LEEICASEEMYEVIDGEVEITGDGVMQIAGVDWSRLLFHRFLPIHGAALATAFVGKQDCAHGS
jgi:hypothetical protein